MRRRTYPIIVVTALAVVLALGPASVVAKGGDAKCPGSVAGLPFDKADAFDDGRLYQVKCWYHKRDRKGAHILALTAYALQPIPGNCEDAAERACPCSDVSCRCFPWPNESPLELGVSLINVRASKAKKAWRTGHKWVAKHRSAVAVCPAAVATPEPMLEDAAPGSTSTIDIVLSGGPGEEPPAIGATIELPENDQHQLVVGGLDGEVIREGFLGDRATVGSYGPLVTDADGNWSVLATVDASTAPEPTPAPTAQPTPAPPSPTPTAEPLTAAPSDPPAMTEEPTPAPTATPTPTPTPTPVGSPTPVPPPELIGIPDAVADLVAGLEPQAAGAVRDLTDSLAALGDELDDLGKGEARVAASDIASLRLLAPDFVKKVQLTGGSILISTNLVDVMVTPIIGKDGLIEFRTNRFQSTIRSHQIVKTLVVALNNYVADHGGRFRTISVTPEGLTVTAERKASE